MRAPPLLLDVCGLNFGESASHLDHPSISSPTIKLNYTIAKFYSLPLGRLDEAMRGVWWHGGHREREVTRRRAVFANSCGCGASRLTGVSMGESHANGSDGIRRTAVTRRWVKGFVRARCWQVFFSGVVNSRGLYATTTHTHTY